MPKKTKSFWEELESEWKKKPRPPLSEAEKEKQLNTLKIHREKKLNRLTDILLEKTYFKPRKIDKDESWKK